MKENNKVLKYLKFFKYFSLILLLICVCLIAYCLLTCEMIGLIKSDPAYHVTEFAYWHFIIFPVQKEILFYSLHFSLFFSCFHVLILFIQLFYTKHLRKKALNEHGRYRK